MLLLSLTSCGIRLNSYMNCGIYKILNTKNGKFYVGSSKDILDRWRRHCSELRKNTHPNKHLQFAWNKYGESSFELNILEECDVNSLLEREQYYLDSTKCTNRTMGYNISKEAGKGPDCTGLRQYHRMKQVNQYTLTGILIKSYICVIDAQHELNINNKLISSCCNRRGKSAGGFLWTHGTNPPEKIDKYAPKKVIYDDKLRKKCSLIQKQLGPNKYIISRRKQISKYDLNGNLLETFKYAKLASEKYGYNETALRSSADTNDHKAVTAYGYIWRYGNDPKIIVPNQKTCVRFMVEQWENGKMINLFNDATSAAMSLHIENIKKISSVITIIRDKSKLGKEYCGFIWRRKYK